MRLSIVAFFVVALAGCSGRSATDGVTDAGTFDAAMDGAGDAIAPLDAPAIDAPGADLGRDGGVDATVIDGGSVIDAGPTPCPASPPGSGAACTPEGLSCSYGDDPRTSCRVRADCTSGSWVVAAPPCSAPPMCPATEPGAGVTCSPTGAACGYATDSCHCFSCEIPCSSPVTWHCSALAPGCPTAPPNLGAACSGGDGSLCDYGACIGSWAVSCDSGIWVEHFTACPG